MSHVGLFNEFNAMILKLLFFLIISQLQNNFVMSKNTTIKHNFHCCQIWELMNQYTIEKSGAKFDMKSCLQVDTQCFATKLVSNFVEQTQYLIGAADFQIDKTSITVISNFDSSQNILHLLVTSYIGRAVSQNKNEANSEFQLMYDVNQNELSVKRSACEFSQGIYSTMVIASICILIFLISMQILEQNKYHQKVDIPKNTLKDTKTLSCVQLKQNTASAVRLPFAFRSQQFC